MNLRLSSLLVVIGCGQSAPDAPTPPEPEVAIETVSNEAPPATLDARNELARSPPSPPGSLRNVPAGPAGAQLGPAGVRRYDPDSVPDRVSGNVLIGSAEPDESFAAVVVTMMRRRSAAFRRCYEAVLRTQPDLAGNLNVRFTVTTRGNVEGAEVNANTTESTELARCVVSVVRRFRFNPGPETDMTYDHPLTFSPD